MPEPPSLAGVIVWTAADRFPALAEFYRDRLGLTPVSQRHQHIAFEWGDVRLTLGVHDHVAGSTREPARVMINFAVDDIHEAFTRLAGSGIEVIRSPEQEGWGGWIATLADPDGNLIQLLQLVQDPG